MFPRMISISKSNSFFLFGARGTGKSYLLKDNFNADEAFHVDLLDPELVAELQAYPTRLNAMIDPFFGKKEWIIIDEIQKVPVLLDVVHKNIEQKRFKFALTGSSARKLKKGAANLLAGRAHIFNLFPLTVDELGDHFNLDEILTYGSLPEVINNKEELDKKRFLRAYTHTYLKEEIITEQIIRQLPPFRRFLDIAGHFNTEPIVLTNIAKDINSDPKTVSRYYDILEDTLLGFYLHGYHGSIRKRQKKTPKFYFFDLGIVRALSGKLNFPVIPKTFEHGQLFESFFINEVKRLYSYLEIDAQFSYLKVDENQEIDLIIEIAGEVIALCEIKSADKVDERYSNKLNLFGDDFPKAKRIIISNDPHTKKFGEAIALHWREALRVLKELVQ